MIKFTCISLLLILSCTKNTTISTDIGEGIEIYLTKIPMTNDYTINYSKINLDTLSLLETPLLLYDDIKTYEKSSHMLSLNISSEKLNVPITSVYGRMFVVTLNKVPIYCGFKWPLISSATCSYVFIVDPLEEVDGLESNQIQIQFTNPKFTDPRSDPRILDRLRKDGKLIE